MSHICRGCLRKMPKDRKGADQYCPKCIEKKKTIKVKMKNKEEHQEAVESYVNGNISNFKEYIQKLSSKEILELLGVFEDYGYNRQKLIWLLIIG